MNVTNHSALLEVAAPAGWRVVPLWALFTRRKLLGHTDEPMLSVFREHGVVRKDSLPNLNKTAEDRSIYQLVDDGWLVVNRMKAFQGSVGVSFERGIVSGHYICYRPRHSESSRYLNWLLRSDVYRTIFHRLSRGVRPGQIEIDNDYLHSVPVLLPPLDVQRRIADFLDDQVRRIDGALARKQAQHELLRQGLLSATFSEVLDAAYPRRRNVDAAWCRSIPDHWQFVRLSLVASMGTGHTPSREQPEYWEDLEIPWVSTADIYGREYSTQPLTDTKLKISQIGLANSAAVLHPAGTVMLCRTASVGLTALTGVPAATSQRFVTWTPGPLLDSHYLLHLIRAMKPEFLRLANGSTHGTVFFPDLESIRIPLPPLEEQRFLVGRVERALSTYMVLDDHLRRSMDLLTKRRSSLIAGAVTGEFDVMSSSSPDRHMSMSGVGGGS